jgi:four helix bundle protein
MTLRSEDFKAKHYFIEDIKGKYEVDLEEKLFQFSLNTIRLLSLVPCKREYDVFRYQLSKSATSIGANYQESQAASYPEFRQRVQICLREARETVYWLSLLRELLKEQLKIKEKIDLIYQESVEIKNIFGSIFNKIRNKNIQS